MLFELSLFALDIAEMTPLFRASTSYGLHKTAASPSTSLHVGISDVTTGGPVAKASTMGIPKPS